MSDEKKSEERKSDNKPEPTDPGRPSAKAAAKDEELSADSTDPGTPAAKAAAEAANTVGADEPTEEPAAAKKTEADGPKEEPAAAKKTEADEPKEKPAAAAKKPAAAAKKPAAAAKKPKEPEPEVAAEDVAEANQMFNRMFNMVERERKLDRGLLNEAERSYDKLMKRVKEQANDMEAFKKKAERSATVLSNYAQLTGGHAKLTQLYFKLESVKELIDDAHALR